MTPRRHPQPRRQRGVAVITALLLTTLAVAIVASLFWQQQVQVRTMENQRLQLQTKWIQRGALDWATLVLQGGMNPTYTSLSQPWATPLEETRLDQYIDRERIEGERYDATLSGNMTDACARYNLRNLALGDGSIDPDQLKVFERLLTLLRMDQSLAGRIADYVVRGEPVTVAATETPDPLVTKKMPREVPGTPMRFLQVDDLLSVPGVTPVMVENLRRFVTVLPARTTVNVNTAPAEVLAALVEGMTVSEANSLVVRRQQAEWRSMAFFQDAINNRTVASNTADVKSDWFLVNSRIRLDRAALDAEALIQRSPMLQAGGPKVWWIRQY
jgi:general secretion pathway protein K